MQTLGERIRAKRQEMQLTLEQLSERSGVEVGTISALEKRKSERSKFAPQLARALGLTLDEYPAAQMQAQSQPHIAAENVAQYSIGGEAHQLPKWPFITISDRQWQALPPAARAQIEAYAAGLIAAHSLR